MICKSNSTISFSECMVTIVLALRFQVVTNRILLFLSSLFHKSYIKWGFQGDDPNSANTRRLFSVIPTFTHSDSLRCISVATVINHESSNTTCNFILIFQHVNRMLLNLSFWYSKENYLIT